MKKLDSEMHLYDRDEQAFEKQAYWNKHMFSSEFDKIYFGWTALQSWYFTPRGPNLIFFEIFTQIERTKSNVPEINLINIKRIFCGLCNIIYMARFVCNKLNIRIVSYEIFNADPYVKYIWSPRVLKACFHVRYIALTTPLGILNVGCYEYIK